MSGQILGRPILVGQAYSFALGRFEAMLEVSILAGLGVILMAITIISIPFAVLFFVRWAFIYQTASLERCGPLMALAQSSDLVRGNWWPVFGIPLLIVILLAIANGIASSILGNVDEMEAHDGDGRGSHILAAVMAAALASGQLVGASGPEALRGVVLGYE